MLNPSVRPRSHPCRMHVLLTLVGLNSSMQQQTERGTDTIYLRYPGPFRSLQLFCKSLRVKVDVHQSWGPLYKFIMGQIEKTSTRHHRTVITILPAWLFRLSRAGKQLLSQVLDCWIWRLLSNRQPMENPQSSQRLRGQTSDVAGSMMSDHIHK